MHDRSAHGCHSPWENRWVVGIILSALGGQQLQTRTTTAPRPLTEEAYCHPAILPRTVTATRTPVMHLAKYSKRHKFWRER
eukprot:10137522-Heterocapsa_arctica.AAC.1